MTVASLALMRSSSVAPFYESWRLINDALVTALAVAPLTTEQRRAR
ncbi:MAG: hypothetical protein ACRDGT_04480 [Candidatus Limnocylindria bacterium]